MQVCKLMYSGRRLLDIDISMFKPFKPMLCKKCDANVFIKEIPDNRTLYVENKFDGERFQLHMQDGNFRYFSRNGFDYTSKFGATYEEGLFTPKLKDIFADHIKSVILDGEMMGYNKHTKEFGSKGMLFDVKTLTATAVHQPCFCVFDVLLLNGVVLMNENFEKRASVLKDILAPKDGVIILSEITTITRKEEVLNALNASVDKGDEGIVVKMPDSTYKPGTRANKWWKVKLEYFEGHMTDMDLLIIGGYYGDGKRFQNRISSFLLAVYDELEEKFRAFAKVASGLTDDELNVLEKKIGVHWKSSNFAAAKNFGVAFGTQTPDVWIIPKDSCVLEVRGSELVKTSQRHFTTGYTLRFPRILRVREDKQFIDVLTLSELNRYATGNKPVLKLTKMHITMEDIENYIKGTRKRKRKPHDEPSFEVRDVKSGILQDYEFCILSGTEEWPSTEIQMNILEHGGNITLTESEKTYCLLAASDDPKIRTFKTLNSKLDIVKLEWLKRVIESGTFFQYKPTDCLYMSKDSKIKSFTHDRYGDSYVELVNESSLMKILENMKRSEEHDDCELSWYDPCLTELCRPLIFYQRYTYFDKYEIINDPKSTIIYDSFLDQMEILYHGGEVLGKLDLCVNLVIIESEERREVVLQYLRENNFKLDVIEVCTMMSLMPSRGTHN